jgi:NADH-quinone oxidoreductase subunit G
MAEMVKLFVNGQEVEVESGKNLIDALAVVGIEIPHFCYHPALGADGNCRMCLVGIEGGRPPLVPACKTPALEGMKVQLDTDYIKKIQRDILEFELINHPVDCPICDQAGECDLQDYYMSYSLESSRMSVPQVTKGKKMDFGCGVVHDQERCVLCARCVRFTRQITRTGELGIVNRTDAARVAIFPGRPLDNRYALNIVDICPVGAMTSKDFRFKQRAWFLKRDEGICHGCSRGCSIYIDHHREKYKDDVIYRFRARKNLLVNGYFICDEGRLSYHRENEQRCTQTIVDGAAVSFEEGIRAILDRLGRAKMVLMLVSPDSTIGQLWAVKRLADLYGADLSGYSDAYVIPGSGDDYLINDDKAANRRGLDLLEIEQDKDSFSAALEKCDLFINFDNDLFFTDVNDDLKPLLDTIESIAVCSHDLPAFGSSTIVLPTASYSEYGGVVVNGDGVLQRFSKAVYKNVEPADIVEITSLLGGAITDWTRSWPGIRQSVPLLSEVRPEQIPAEGLKLAESEDSHVTT